jgi:hypothetical protein
LDLQGRQIGYLLKLGEGSPIGVQGATAQFGEPLQHNLRVELVLLGLQKFLLGQKLLLGMCRYNRRGTQEQENPQIQASAHDVLQDQAGDESAADEIYLTMNDHALRRGEGDMMCWPQKLMRAVSIVEMKGAGPDAQAT